VTYTFVAQGLAMPVGIFGNDLEQAERIRTGEVAMDLIRPYDYQGWWAAVAGGKALFYGWARGIPPFVAGSLVLDTRLPDRWWIWPAFLASAALAVGACFALRFLVQLLAFWLTDVRGPNQIVAIAGGFLAGILVPLALLPSWLLPVARALPFASMLDAPIEVFLGRRAGAALAGTLALQAAWIVVLVTAGRWVLRRAVVRLEVAGG
jgi:ABC-2 type transport system permease protein